MWELPPGGSLANVQEVEMTGSRIMVHLFYSDECDMTVWKIVVWNWKTGELVIFHDLIDGTLLNFRLSCSASHPQTEVD